MRTIKFRAYDTISKSMLSWEELTCKANNLKLSQLVNRKNGNLKWLEFTGHKDNTKWEQLTKDEQDKWIEDGNTKENWNGKEIYEGDICQLYLQKFTGKFEVIWHNSKWLYKEVGKNDNYFNFSFDSKVIGSVYENPELLKGKK